MTEFTSEWIASQRYILNLREDKYDWSNYLSLQAINEIELLQFERQTWIDKAEILETQAIKQRKEIEKLRKENNKLNLRLAASKNDFILKEVGEMLKNTQIRVQEFEKKCDLVLSERNHAYDTLGWSREISIYEFAPKSKLKQRIKELETQLKSKEIIINNLEGRLNYYATKNLLGGGND